MSKLDDREMILDKQLWPGETLCMKRRPKPGERVGVMGYAAFGVLTQSQVPLVVYLRPDFVKEQRYESVNALLADGWIVD